MLYTLTDQYKHVSCVVLRKPTYGSNPMIKVYTISLTFRSWGDTVVSPVTVWVGVSCVGGVDMVGRQRETSGVGAL